jgi:putative endonuclease
LKRPVWYEAQVDMPAAIRREKAIKAWQRSWKLRIIEDENPEWNDLWPGLFGEGLSAEAWLAVNFPEESV